MIFQKDTFVIYVDDTYAGICDSEFDIWDTAQNFVNGCSISLTDDNFCDRVSYYIINVNRWKVDNKYKRCIEDKYSKNNILCHNDFEAEIQEQHLNSIDIERERAEAKLRAMAL